MSTPTGFDAVLAATPPRFDVPAILDIAAETFGLRPAGARDLGSERDQAFLLLDAADGPMAVMKLSNAAEDPATLDMELLAVRHAALVDPSLPLALPWARPGMAAGDPDPAAYRAIYRAADGVHHVRMYDVLPGRQRDDPRGLSDAALIGWGETSARLGRALRGFFHPAAQRTMLWDVQHAGRTRAMVEAIRDDRRRTLVERVLDRYAATLEPAWPSLRAQVVHGDLTCDNALTDADGRITGIVDFGDMSYSALLIDLAGVLDSVCTGRDRDEMFRAARLVIDGYERVTPLEPLERRLLGEGWAARAAVTIAISSWRADRGLEDGAFAERYNAAVARVIADMLELGWDEVARRLGADVEDPGDRGALLARRDAVLGPALEPLSYDEPIEMASASGIWMVDRDGRRYLDAYNNVPCVGHGHPRVTEAISRASRRLNTNLRYLHPAAIELAERLCATMPAGLDTVLYVNSGSEANDLAWRLATVWSGQAGGLCSEYAYHGITAASAALSPESWGAGRRPDHVATWDVAGAGDAMAEAIARLAALGHRPAAAIMDGLLTSDGYPTVDAPTVTRWLADVHAAGGLWIADEVQGGHGRSGAMWSFGRHGIVPDIVTLGKPMGNGHPVGAVVTRREIAGRFADETVFFSTFGGNPVSASTALAVLDVIADERLVERAAVTGARLRDAIAAVAAGHDAIVEVRGVGLATGIECRDGARASAIREGLRANGVLVGTCGARGDVLKVRPPLAFAVDDIPVFTAALETALGR